MAPNLVSSGEILEALQEEDEHLSFLRRNVQIRHILSVMEFLSFAILNMLKVNMSMGLVCMVDWYYLPNDANQTCHYDVKDKRSHYEDGDFGTHTDMQGHILAGYFYGLLVFQYISVMLAERLSPKYLQLIGILISSICSIAIPLVAHLQGGLYIIFLQILNGAANALIIPAYVKLIEKWLPRSERFFTVCLIGSGTQFGACLGTYASGVICRSETLGWTYIFYIFGGMGLVWCLFSIVMISDSPLTHPYITHHERHQIMKGQEILPRVRVSVPYKYILKSLPVWAFVIVGFVAIWAEMIYIMIIPIFLTTILKFGTEMTGVWASLPYIAEMVIFLFSCVLNDRLIKIRRVREINVHKWSITIGLLGLGAFMLAIPFTGCYRVLTVTFLTLALGFSGFILVSTSYIPLQLSPHFSSDLLAIMNTVCAIAGIILPTMMGYITKERRSMHEWEILFFLTTALSLFALVFFWIFSSWSVQEWDSPEFQGLSEQVLEVEIEGPPSGKISFSIGQEKEEETEQ